MYALGSEKSNLLGTIDADNFIIDINVPETYDISTETNDIVDQGDRGICVSIVMNEMLDYHYKQMNKDINISLDYFYSKRFDIDIDGMSPREAFDIAVSDNMITQFAKVNSLYILKATLLANGPVMLCIYARSENEKFWVGDKILGGHAVTVTGWTKNSLILKNSWGINFAKNGYTYLPFDEFTSNNIYESWCILL